MSSALRLRAPGSCQQRRPASARHSSPAPTSMSESSFRASVSPRVSARSAPAFVRSAQDPQRMPAERPQRRQERCPLRCACAWLLVGASARLVRQEVDCLDEYVGGLFRASAGPGVSARSAPVSLYICRSPTAASAAYIHPPPTLLRPGRRPESGARFPPEREAGFSETDRDALGHWLRDAGVKRDAAASAAAMRARGVDARTAAAGSPRPGARAADLSRAHARLLRRRRRLVQSLQQTLGTA